MGWDEIERRIEEIFKKSGFEFVETSLIEPEEVARYGTEKFIRFEKGGTTFTVREDFTPQVAHLLRNAKGRRKVYYKGFVFRETAGGWKEIYQIGCDIIPADEEGKKVCARVLREVCSVFPDFTVVVGDYEVFGGIDESFVAKNFDFAVRAVGKDTYRALFPSLKKAPSRESEKFARYLDTDRIIFSPAVEKRRSYYCGIFFGVFAGGVQVVSGGEWEIYRRGIGFSVNLSLVRDVLSGLENKSE